MAEPVKENQGEESSRSGPGSAAATDVIPQTQKYLRDTAELIRNLKALGGITALEAKIDELSVDLKGLRSDLNGLGGRITRVTGRINTAEKLFGFFVGAGTLFLGAVALILTIFGQPIVSYILQHYSLTFKP